MTVTAPATSKARSSDSARVSASSRGESAKAIRLTGTLTQSTHSQPRPSVRMPPSRTPAAPPEPGDRAPDAERLVALGAVAEGGGDDRERGGGDDRGAEPLGGAGGDQLALGGGEARGERGDGDQQQAGHEDLAAADRSAVRPPSSRKPPKVST